MLIWTTKAIQKPAAETECGHTLEREDPGYLGPQEDITMKGRIEREKESILASL